MLKCRHWYSKRSTWQAPLWLSQAAEILFRIWKVKWYIVLVSLCLVLLGNDETKDDDATANYWAAQKTSFVTNISLFNGRKYRTILLHNSRTENEISNTHKQTLHWKDISKLSLASNIHHSYVAQHRSHGCGTKFPILTLANTSLKRIKLVYTPKNKEASIPNSCCF